MTKILADKEIRKKLQTIFQCRREMISLSLNGHRDTDLAKRIRKAALQLGGSEKKEKNKTYIEP